MRTIIFKRRDNGWFRGAIGNWNDFLSGIANVTSKRFQFPQELPLVHNGGASMFNQSGGNIVIGILVMSMQCPVEILRDAFSALGERLFIPTGLGIN